MHLRRIPENSKCPSALWFAGGNKATDVISDAEKFSGRAFTVTTNPQHIPQVLQGLLLPLGSAGKEVIESYNLRHDLFKLWREVRRMDIRKVPGFFVQEPMNLDSEDLLNVLG